MIVAADWCDFESDFFFLAGREEGQAEAAAVGERGANCGSGNYSSEGGGASGDSQNASGLDGTVPSAYHLDLHGCRIHRFIKVQGALLLDPKHLKISV